MSEEIKFTEEEMKQVSENKIIDYALIKCRL